VLAPYCGSAPKPLTPRATGAPPARSAPRTPCGNSFPCTLWSPAEVRSRLWTLNCHTNPIHLQILLP